MKCRVAWDIIRILNPYLSIVKFGFIISDAGPTERGVSSTDELVPRRLRTFGGCEHTAVLPWALGPHRSGQSVEARSVCALCALLG